MSEIVHQPLALAVSMTCRPELVMRPVASMSAARCRFNRDQELFDLRGVMSCRLRSWSSKVTVESIQPKQIASSTTSGYGHRGLSVTERHEHNQTPGAVS